MSENYFVDYEFGSAHNLHTQIKDLISINLNSNTLEFYNFVYYNRIKYSVEDLIVMKRKSLVSMPIFASISTVAYEKVTHNFFLIVECLNTIEYVPFLTGYLLANIQDSMLKTVPIESIAHYAPLDCYTNKNSNNINSKIVIIVINEI